MFYLACQKGRMSEMLKYNKEANKKITTTIIHRGKSNLWHGSNQPSSPLFTEWVKN